MVNSRSKAKSENYFWHTICPSENVVLIDLKFLVNSSWIQQTVLFSKDKEDGEKCRCWNQFSRVGSPRYLGFFKVNKCKHMLPHAFQSSHYALWETKFDFPLCVIYNAKVHWLKKQTNKHKTTLITPHLHVLMLPLSTSCASRMLVRWHHLLQTQSAFSWDYEHHLCAGCWLRE